MSHEIEEGTTIQLDFGKLKKVAQCEEDVLPVVAQDVETGDVLIIGYANQLALETTLEKGMATFWNTSRNELWIKGAESGNTYELLEVRVNCEQNSLLYRVRPKAGGICHTRNAAGEARDCYYRRLDFDTRQLENLNP